MTQTHISEGILSPWGWNPSLWARLDASCVHFRPVDAPALWCKHQRSGIKDVVSLLTYVIWWSRKVGISALIFLLYVTTCLMKFADVISFIHLKSLEIGSEEVRKDTQLYKNLASVTSWDQLTQICKENGW